MGIQKEFHLRDRCTLLAPSIRRENSWQARMSSLSRSGNSVNRSSIESPLAGCSHGLGARLPIRIRYGAEPVRRAVGLKVIGRRCNRGAFSGVRSMGGSRLNSLRPQWRPPAAFIIQEELI